MITQEIFENELYPDLKEYLMTHSIYAPTLVKRYTGESKVFPLVTMLLYRTSRNYTNLTYGEKTYDFRMDIDIYTKDLVKDGEKVSKRIVGNEITKHIVDFFETYYTVSIRVNYDTVNMDGEIYRNNVRISGVLDTKYGVDNLVTYPQ
jgi:hypothetical protein